MKIIGIDPGTINAGYGIIKVESNTFYPVNYGYVGMAKMSDIAEKLEAIYGRLDELIKKHKPDVMCIETAFYGKNVQSALKIGLARGAAILAGRHNGLTIKEYAPREIKKAVTGNGAASKEQVCGMVKTLLNLKKATMKFDESDALAIAICHGLRYKTFNSGQKSWKSFLEQNPERILG